MAEDTRPWMTTRSIPDAQRRMTSRSIPSLLATTHPIPLRLSGSDLTPAARTVCPFPPARRQRRSQWRSRARMMPRFPRAPSWPFALFILPQARTQSGRGGKRDRFVFRAGWPILCDSKGWGHDDGTYCNRAWRQNLAARRQPDRSWVLDSTKGDESVAGRRSPRTHPSPMANGWASDVHDPVSPYRLSRPCARYLTRVIH